MLEFPRWKYLVILLVLALSVIYALPNVFQSDYAVQITGNRGAVLDDVLKSRVVDQLGKAGVQPGSVAIENDSLMVRLAAGGLGVGGRDQEVEKAHSSGPGGCKQPESMP